MSGAYGATLLERVLDRLEVVRGPDRRGNYRCWCIFHPDRLGKNPNLDVHEKGYICRNCGASGGLHELARHLGIAEGNGAGVDPTYHVYRNVDGSPLYRIGRVGTGSKKKIWQQRPNGSAGWTTGRNGIPLVLYKLPELAARPDEIVYLVEGEGCVEALLAADLLATTAPEGAKASWLPQYSETLRGRHVVVLADNDDPGRQHRNKVVAALRGVAKSIKVVDLPGLPEKGDIVDWFAAGNSVADLVAVVDGTPEYAQGAGSTAEGDPGEIHNSDLGNARRLVAAHGEDIRFVPPWKRWLVWDGVRWRPDETGSVDRLAKDVVGRLYPEAGKAPDSQDRADLAKFAIRSEMEPRLRAMVALAQTESGIPVLPRDLDQDPWLLNVQNGTIDLHTGSMTKPARGNLMTKSTSVVFDPEAQCPTWDAFLDRVMDGNTELIHFLQRAVGYSMTGLRSEHVVFILYGLGRNGKSTFLETIRALFGEYGCQTEAQTFMEIRSDRIRNDLARLAGVRLVTAVETERRGKLSEPLIKQITGGDTITARFLRREYFEFTPTFTPWLATNHKPEIAGTDEGIWRRPKLIPFTTTIPEEEQDKELLDKLKAELPGILNWAIRGCSDWRRIGLLPPDDVTRATQEYREENDVLAAFIAERCVVGPGNTVTASALLEAHSTWAAASREETLSQRRLAAALAERGLLKDRGGCNGRVRYLGIGLRATEEGC